MKDSLKYLKLWQKKRSELPVNDDPQSDWLNMQSLLDKHLPATGHTVSKSSFHLKVLKMLPKLFITFSAAAMVYTVSHVIKSHTSKPHHNYKLHRGSQSVPDSLAIDSLNADSISNLKDRLHFATQAVTTADSLMIDRDNNNVMNSQPANKATSFAPFNTPLASSLSINKGTSFKQQLINTPFSVIKNNNAILNTAKNKRIAVAINQPKNKLVNSASTFGSTKAGSSYLSGVSKRHYNRVNAYNGIRVSHIPNHRTANKQEMFNDSVHNDNTEPLHAAIPQLKLNKDFSINISKTAIIKHTEYNTFQKPPSGKSIKSEPGKDRNLRIKIPAFSNFDWGILTGVNASGSFTPANQNANFYGSLPVDIYLGLFTTYNLNDKWAINMQTQFYSPQTINTNYTHANASKVDSGQSLKITSSRKLYSVNIPLKLVYKATSNVNIKAGPVFSLPIKQTNTSNTLQPYSLKADTPYYAKITDILNSSKYTQKFNLGFSAGASVRVRRFIFEAAYLKSLSGYPVVNNLGNYKSNNGTLQFSIGFQLNKPKK